MFQVVVIDAKDYILKHRDFHLDYDGELPWDFHSYVTAALKDKEAVKIHIRKWDE